MPFASSCDVEYLSERWNVRVSKSIQKCFEYSINSAPARGITSARY